MSTGTVARSPTLAAVDPPWQPPPCPAVGPARVAEPGAWYRLDGVQDGSGTLVGQRLAIGVLGGAARTMELPAESFASGPVDGLVLVGADDGRRSRLSLVDPARGCSTVIADERDVVRSALVSRDGTAVWEHRVARGTREDLGVWRRSLDGGRATRQLRPLPADDRYGRTFTTELRWAPDGSLASTSCGAQACRTRTLAPGGGPVTTIGPTGDVIGIARDGSVVAFAPCGGDPCSILARDRRGHMRVLAEGAGRATLAGDRLLFRVRENRLLELDVRRGALREIPAADDLVPLRGGSLATAGADHAPDVALLVPDGPFDGRTARVLEAGGAAPVLVTEVAP